MSPGAQDSPVSTVLVDESFATQDDRFVERVRSVTSPKYLAGLADRWKKDPRPWAREQIIAYLALPLDRPGHHPLVKRLFKQAEANRDDQLMAVFLIAFDRLVRRQRRNRYRYDFTTRQVSHEETLYSPKNQILASNKGRVARNPRTGEVIFGNPPRGVPRNGRLFSYRTRRYLRRRVWRYFRRMGFQKPAQYPQAIAKALAMYGDVDFAHGENILDNWSLMHIAFRRSPVLEFSRSGVGLAEERSLGELAAAPQFEKLWREPASANVILNLVIEAKSRLVRVWAIQLLKRDHAAALNALSADQLLTLLDHADDDVQQFAAGLLQNLAGVDRWSIATWLRLLETRSVAALGSICQAMNERVSPERLTLVQCVDLACARATPVARLALSWLQVRPFTKDEDRAALARLAGIRCDAVAADATRFALAILGTAQNYRMEQVVSFFDSLNLQVRRTAWDWLTPESAAYSDPALWSRLLETPYDDVRIRLIEELARRTRRLKDAPVLQDQDLERVWTTVLLGVHRGGRAKLKALRQIAQAMADRPDRAERLVPVLAVAIRSVRRAESRAGLSAILTAVSALPRLEAVLARLIPELRLSPTEWASLEAAR